MISQRSSVKDLLEEIFYHDTIFIQMCDKKLNKSNRPIKYQWYKEYMVTYCKGILFINRYYH